jgi:hypothetical protein
MASRKMTFTLPEELASRFSRTVRGRDRSRYVTEAIAARLREQDERLLRACEAANGDPDVAAIEREWDSLPERITEPWTDAPSR